MLDDKDVVRLLRSEVEQAGGQSAWARRERIDRALLNRVLCSHKPPTAKIIRALALKTAGKKALIPIRRPSALHRRPWNDDCDAGFRCETFGAAQQSCRIEPAGRMDRGLGTTGPVTRSFVCCSTLSRRGSCQYYLHSVANGRLEIAVEVERKDQTLVARIEDNGSAFDPTQVPPPPIPASLDEAKVGDIGIHLMRSFASGIHYERRDGTNRLTMHSLRSTQAREGKEDAND